MPQNSETTTQLFSHLHSPSAGAGGGVFRSSSSKRDLTSSESSAPPSSIDDSFIARNIFLMTIVNKMNTLSDDVTVVFKDSIHMDKVVNIPSSFVIKKSCDFSSSSSPFPFVAPPRVNMEFGCVFFKTQEEFSFLMSRATEGSAADIACQFVLPPHLFEEAVRAGYGKAHPFAGMYHPVLKMTVPATLLSIFTPSTQAGNEFLLNCVHEAYLFAKETC